MPSRAISCPQSDIFPLLHPQRCGTGKAGFRAGLSLQAATAADSVGYGTSWRNCIPKKRAVPERARTTHRKNFRHSERSEESILLFSSFMKGIKMDSSLRFAPFRMTLLSTVNNRPTPHGGKRRLIRRRCTCKSPETAGQAKAWSARSG